MTTTMRRTTSLKHRLPRDDAEWHTYRIDELKKRCAACLDSLLATGEFCKKCRVKDRT